MIDKNAPIAVFSYNRPAHVRRLFTSLERCIEVDFNRIHIFCDGAKSNTDQEQVNANRKVVNDWAKRVGAHVIEHENNLGLANSIVSGVEYFCDRYGQVIVLEDDLVVAPDFVQFMDRGLAKYAHEQNVFQISGYNFPLASKQPSEIFFLPLTTSWGWATWKRAWKYYSLEIGGILDSPEKLHDLDLQGAYPFSRILKFTLEGKAESWGIFWRLSVFRANGLVLYPPRSLVWQGGFDGSGVHCGNQGGQRIKNAPLSYRFPRLPQRVLWPEVISGSPIAMEQIREHLRNHDKNLHWASGKESLLKSALIILNRSFH